MVVGLGLSPDERTLRSSSCSKTAHCVGIILAFFLGLTVPEGITGEVHVTSYAGHTATFEDRERRALELDVTETLT
jgi:hypothetical protein